MPSLTQLLTIHERLLVLDAASTRVQVGLWCAGSPARWQAVAQEAGTGIFAGVDALLTSSGTTLDAVGAFVFCEGPGSMLGIRTVAMALRTWQVLHPRPVYSYQSLAVAAGHEWARRPRAFAAVADARRETWHCQEVDSTGGLPPLRRVPAADLPAGELVGPENFRAWSPPPRPLAACSYDLAVVFPAIAGGDYFRRVESPDAFQHEAPEYKKWSARIHQAATAPTP